MHERLFRRAHRTRGRLPDFRSHLQQRERRVIEFRQACAAVNEYQNGNHLRASGLHKVDGFLHTPAPGDHVLGDVR